MGSEVVRNIKFQNFLGKNTTGFIGAQDFVAQATIESAAIDLCCEQKFPKISYVNEAGLRIAWVKWINEEVSCMNQRWLLVVLFHRYNGREGRYMMVS